MTDINLRGSTTDQSPNSAHLRSSTSERSPLCTSSSYAAVNSARESMVYRGSAASYRETCRRAWKGRQNKLTRGTPTKITLFSAASRIRAALRTASVTLDRDFGSSGSFRVAKRYRCPSVVGRLTVRSVHVYSKSRAQIWSSLKIDSILDKHRMGKIDKGSCKIQARVRVRENLFTVRTSHPVSAFLCFASVSVRLSTA